MAPAAEFDEWGKYLVIAVLAGEIILFASNKVRLDFVAFLGLFILWLSGILNDKQALSGFGQSTTMQIATSFVLGKGIQVSGLADELAQILKKGTGGREWVFLLEMMLMTAALSAFMSNAGTVAIMMPVAISTIEAQKWDRRLFLMPLTFAASLGGMLTLIGTPTNIAMSGDHDRSGAGAIGFFEFAPIGLVCLVVGIAYNMTMGRWILSKISPVAPVDAEAACAADAVVQAQTNIMSVVSAVGDNDSDTDRKEKPESSGHVSGRAYQSYTHCLRLVEVAKGSSLINKPFWDCKLHPTYGVDVLAFCTQQNQLEVVDYRHVFAVGDRMLISLEREGCVKLDDKEKGLVVLGEVSVPANVVLLQCGGVSDSHPSYTPVPTLDGVYAVSDKDAKTAVGTLYGSGLVHFGKQLPLGLYLTVLIMVLVVGLMVGDVASSALLMMVGSVAMTCVPVMTAMDAYRAIHWESVVLIAAMIPMSDAMKNTGITTAIVDWLTEVGKTSSATVVLALICILAGVMTQIMSNTATAVLISPVATSVSKAMGVSVTPFLICLATASSCAFATPVGSPCNIIVMNPGKYTFLHFMMVGTLLTVLEVAVVIAVGPLIYPF